MPILRIPAQQTCTVRSLLRSAGVSAQLTKQLKACPDGITRGGVQIHTDQTVCAGETLELRWTEHCDFDANAALSVPVAYESEGLLVCGKPVGMPVHPSMLHRSDTLANWFAAFRPGCGFHAVNRLDRNTSGLCLIAKDAHAANAVSGTVEKRYFALVKPGLHGEGTVDAPIARAQASVITRCVRSDGQRAVTHWRVLRENETCTLLMLTLQTGRTHQIRVHMAHIGYPLLGDDLYGGDCTLLHAHALHCGWLTFTEPEAGRRITLKCPLRTDMQALMPESDITRERCNDETTETDQAL